MTALGWVFLVESVLIVSLGLDVSYQDKKKARQG